MELNATRKEPQATGGASSAQKTSALTHLTSWEFYQNSLTTKNKADICIYFLKEMLCGVLQIKKVRLQIALMLMGRHFP